MPNFCKPSNARGLFACFDWCHPFSGITAVLTVFFRCRLLFACFASFRFVPFAILGAQEIRRARHGGGRGGDEARMPGAEITNLRGRPGRRPASGDAGPGTPGLAPEVEMVCVLAGDGMTVLLVGWWDGWDGGIGGVLLFKAVSRGSLAGAFLLFGLFVCYAGACWTV